MLDKSTDDTKHAPFPNVKSSAFSNSEYYVLVTLYGKWLLIVFITMAHGVTIYFTSVSAFVLDIVV